jgi:hypothetical protein
LEKIVLGEHKLPDQVNQRFIVVADNDWGAYSVHDLHIEQTAIDCIEQEKRGGRNITHIFCDSVKMSAAVQYAEGRYPHYHRVKNALAL